MKHLLMSLCLCLFMVLVSCTNLPEDPHPNPAQYGYHRMEFDVKGIDGEVKKEIGLANFYLRENQDLSGLFFRFYGIYQGTLRMISDACGINTAVSFKGTHIFYLEDLIDHPMKCSIRMIAETDEIGGKQHRIVETGLIKINVLPKNSEPATIEYTRTNSLLNVFYKDHVYIGQGSLQRQEGDLTYTETFKVKTGVDGGGSFRIVGCGKEYTDEYSGSDFEVSFKDIYKKDYLGTSDTCDLEINAIPNESLYRRLARFSVNIFDKKVVKLEPLEYVIDDDDLEVEGKEYIMACSINGTYTLDHDCDAEYNTYNTYWIRGLTSNGRKSIFAIKDGSVIWKE